jgi:arylsulfatase A-like enzyme
MRLIEDLSMNDRGSQLPGGWRAWSGVFLFLALCGCIGAVLESMPVGRPWMGLPVFLKGMIYGVNLHLVIALLVFLGGRLVLWRMGPQRLLIVCGLLYLCFELGLVGGFWLSRLPVVPPFYTQIGKIALFACGCLGVIAALLLALLSVRRQWHKRWLSGRAGSSLAGVFLAGLLLLVNVIGVMRAMPDESDSAIRENSAEVKQENVIVILIDTLRRDHLSYFGYHRPTSSNIDRLFNESWVFTQAYTPSSWTMPSVTSLFTGLYPSSHHVVSSANRVPDDAIMIAEHFRSYGYRTGAFISNQLVNGSNGFAQGFEWFTPTRPMFWMYHRQTAVEQIVLELRQSREQSRGWRLNQQSIAWLKDAPDEPHFTYMHYMEPHSVYEPPQADRDAVAPGVPPGRDEPPTIENYRDLLREMECNDWECIDRRPELTEDEFQGMLANYDGEIHLVDRRVGAFLDELKQMGLYENSHIIFCVDHGEEFGDHGGWFHGNSIYEEMTGCALSYRPPGGFDSSVQITRPVSLMDVMPTLCTRLGMDIPPMHQGSLIPELLGTGCGNDRTPVLSELPPYLYSLRLGPWKMIQRGPKDSPAWRLFDLENDRGELYDVAEEYPDTLAYLKGYLEGIVARNKQTSLKSSTNNADPELLRQLRNLGYIQ